MSLDRQNVQVVYFYCHGGRNESDTWLGVGKKERIVPYELRTWKVRWKLGHPFVFINGCRTVDVTPDDFIAFKEIFAYCEAAGVMGTEITIPETLGRYFATGFLQSFFKGMKVGEAILQQRMTMLKNFNLLGLAYTPYCSSDLRIIHS